MAKRKTNTKRRSSKKNSKGILTTLAGWITATHNDPESMDRARKVLAWSLIFFGLLSLIACFSHFGNGPADQSEIQHGVAGNQNNLLGFFGASIANMLITRGFGVFGMLIPAYLGLIGLVLLEEEFQAFAKRMFKYVFFILIWGSTFISFIVGLLKSQNYDLGGGVGHYINSLMQGYVAKVGVAFLLIFVVIIFVVINFNMEVRASRLIEKLSALKSGDNSKDETAPKNKKQTTSKKKGASVKDRVNSLLNAAPGEDDASSRGLDTPSAEKVDAKAGEQIAFDLSNKNASPPKLKVSTADLDFVIEEPEKEAIAKEEEKPEGVKEYEQLGNDNVGVVKGDGTVQKIVPKEDQELTDLEDFEAFDPTRELSTYEFPSRTLLVEHGGGGDRSVDRDELVANKNKIVETLKNYKIEIVSIKATVGPTVTLYEIVPAPGVRISKIKNLEDDIALSLAALGIRIIAPIPGRGTIGIEVPNSNPEIVSMRGVLSTEKFATSKAELPIALGRTIDNKVYLTDLNKMPHLLIAGATGQGKSVGLNSVIASLLFKKHPAEVKFVLIDPKKVEMSLYQSLSHHFLAKMPNQKEPIITDVREAINVLRSLGMEMDQRYDLLKAAKVRNLKEYNNKFLARKLNPRKGHFFMPYIVLVIDELADLMMIGGKEVELPIARLAQLARAIGIHLVVATQRPSVNVITGIIKANFPARMSYRVISKVDSRTILDANGADQLMGRGDMLLATGSEMVRIQNAFIDTPEVEALVDFISAQRGYPDSYILPEIDTGDDDGIKAAEPFEMDSMFDEAARIVVKFQMGSTSLIQRKLKLGYNRAGRIVDQLERAGIVGAHSGSKAREVMILDEAELEKYLKTLS